MNNEKDIEKKIAEKLSTRQFNIKPEWEADINSRLDEYNRSKKRVVVIILAFTTIASVVAAIWIFNGFNLESTSNKKQPLTLQENTNTEKQSTNNSTITPTKEDNLFITEHEAQKQTSEKRIVTLPPPGISNLTDSSPASSQPSVNRLRANGQSISTTHLSKNKNTDIPPKEKITATHMNVKDSISAKNIDSTMSQLNNIQRDSSINQVDSTIKTTQNSAADKKNKNNSWELGFVMGPSAILKKQDKHESAASYIDYKLSISNRLTDKLRYNTGINYTSYGETLKYEAIKHILYDTTFQYNNYIEEIIDSQFNNNTQRWVYDTTRVPRTDTITTINQIDKTDDSPLAANGKTKFTYVEIPFTISYPLVTKNRYKLNILGGGSVGYLIKSTGNYYFDKRVIKAQSQKIIYNALLGVNLDYDVGHNINLRTQMSVKQNLRSISITSAPSRRYNVYNISLGVVYKF